MNAISATGLNAPDGIAVDSQNAVYVSDFNNARVLKFATPVTNAVATILYGQTGFTARVIGAPYSSSMAGPAGLTVSSSGSLYVAVPAENRVLGFMGSVIATTVYGQSSFTASSPNISTAAVRFCQWAIRPRGCKGGLERRHLRCGYGE